MLSICGVILATQGKVLLSWAIGITIVLPEREFASLF